MKLSGTATMHAPADRVWAALTDPAVLAASIPGCERLEPSGPDSYRFTIAAGVAPIQGSYTGEVALSQPREPTSFVLTARGTGGPGTVATSIRIILTPAAAGTTELGYEAEATISGLLAGLGPRVLASAARRLIDEFFASVDQILTGRKPVAARPAPPTAAFLGGALVGAAVTLAGAAVRGLIGRRSR